MSLSVATIQSPAAIYREEQWFSWWIYAALGLISVLAWVFLLDRTVGWPSPWMHFHGRIFKTLVATGVVLPPSVVVAALRMITLVTPAEIRVSFGLIPTYRRIISIDAITSVEVVHYHPLRNYGGWGIRFGRDGERVLNARGDRGVRLGLRDGSKLLIGSQRPDELALAIEAARRPGI